MKKQCKIHKWRVRSKNGIIKNKKIVAESINIWCERCGKVIKAYYEPREKIIRRSPTKRWRI